MKKQKQAGNTDTLVDFDQISQIAAQAKTLHLAYLLEQDEGRSNQNNKNVFDM